MNKKAQLSGKIMAIIIFGLVIGLFIVFAWVGLIALPILSDSMGELGSTMIIMSHETGDEQIINATEPAFTPVVEVANNMEWVTFTVFIIMLLTLLLMGFYVRSYPFLAFVWIFIVLILVFVSLFITTAYQEMRVGALGSVYQSWETTDFYLRYMPHITFLIGLFGGIILFALGSNQPDQEGVYI